MIKRDGEFGKTYNCLDTDLVDNFPPTTEYEPGTIMMSYNSTSKQLEYMFKLVDAGNGKEWMELL